MKILMWVMLCINTFGVVINILAHAYIDLVLCIGCCIYALWWLTKNKAPKREAK